jgi:TonB family protein
MRPTILAALLLSPVLTASAVASTPKSDAVAPKNVRVTTGVIAPQIVDSSALRIPSGALGLYGASQAKVVLSFQVDEKGNAQGVRVVKSVNPTVDAAAVEGVLKSRFRPASLDNTAVPMEMNLTILVQR